MRPCDICGCDLGPDSAFAICPACLLEGALDGPPVDDEHVPNHPAPPTSSNQTGLFPRRDFFEKYEILESLARGGQGDLWHVWDIEFRRSLAMKRLNRQDANSETALYRFLAEAQIASQLDHPGILPIFDLGLDPDGRPYYTTQLLPGFTLADLWREFREPGRCKMPALIKPLESIVQVCDIIAHAHGKGVIHRDLKPANILVGRFGDIRVIDWGSAGLLPSATDLEQPFVRLNAAQVQTTRQDAIATGLESTLATGSGGQPVTLLFVPPEILSGQCSRPGPEFDVYSVGIMLYELLTGVLPYSDDGIPPHPDELKRRIIAGPPASIRSIRPRTPKDLACICHKAIAHDRSQRYEKIEYFADDIRAFLHNRPVQARKPGPIQKLQKWTIRNAASIIWTGAALLIVAIAFAVNQGLKADRDAALRTTALRSADLAARNGQWRDVLRHLAGAERAGYADQIDLGLQRAEAWTILSAPKRAEMELNALLKRSDLGDRRAVVLLRAGEHELFNPLTAKAGVQHVREAASLGLSGAESLFAQGLLAPSTPEALDCFGRALRINSFHHGARRQSIGLEFILARRAELQESLRLFGALYPADPSAASLEAAELALHGNPGAAISRLLAISNSLNSAQWSRLTNGLSRLSAVSRDCDLDTLLESNPSGMPAIHLFSTGTNGASAMVVPAATADFQLPMLPCIQTGVLEGQRALAALMLPFVGNIQSAVERIIACHRAHPEALTPAFAAFYLETRQPTNGQRSVPLLKLQSELLQMAAGSPSVLPGLDRTARYLAARAQLELLRADAADGAQLRSSLLSNIRYVLSTNNASIRELNAYFELAMNASEYDSARALLSRLHDQNDAPDITRSRIRLELADRNPALALSLLNSALSTNQDDPWLRQQHEVAITALRNALDSTAGRQKLPPAQP